MLFNYPTNVNKAEVEIPSIEYMYTPPLTALQQSVKITKRIICYEVILPVIYKNGTRTKLGLKF